MGAKMLLNRGEVVKGDRIFLILRPERYCFSCLVLPLLDDLGISGDFNCAPVVVEAHPPTKPLFVEGPKGGLESVIVGGSENLASQGATSNGCKISFNRLFFDDLGLVKLVFLLVESVSLQSSRVHCDRSLVAELVKHRVIVQGAHADPVSLGSL